MVSAKAIPTLEMPLGFSEALVATKSQFSLSLHPNLLHLLWHVLIPNRLPAHNLHFRAYMDSIWFTLISCCIPQCLEQCLKGAWLIFVEQINEREDSHLSSQRRIYGHGWILYVFTGRQYRATFRKVIQLCWSKNAATLWTTPMDDLSFMSQFQFLVFSQKHPESLQCDLIAHLTFLQTIWRRHLGNYLYFLNDKTED